MSKTYKLILTALVASFAVFLLVMQVPRFGVLLLLIPGIYIWLGFSLPTQVAYVVGSLFFIATTLLVVHPLGMMIGLFGALIPIMMTLVAKHDYLEDIITKTVVMGYVGLLATQYYLLKIYKIDLYELYLGSLRTLITQWQTTGVDTTGTFNSLSNSYLSFLFILATALALGLYAIANFLRKLNLIRWQVQPFYTFKFKGLNWLQFGIVLVLFYLLRVLDPPYQVVGENGIQFVMVLFAIQGLSVASFYLKKRNVSRFVSLFILGFTLMMPLLNTMISLLGFSDSLFDFRKLEVMK